MNLEKKLLSFENKIHAYEANEVEEDVKFLREELRKYLGSCCGEDDCSSQSVADLIGLAVNNTQNRRVAGIVITRCLSVEKLIPDNNSKNQIDRKIVNLAKNAIPDICNYFKIDEKKQNYEKISILRTVHQKILEKIAVIKAM